MNWKRGLARACIVLWLVWAIAAGIGPAHEVQQSWRDFSEAKRALTTLAIDKTVWMSFPNGEVDEVWKDEIPLALAGGAVMVAPDSARLPPPRSKGYEIDIPTDEAPSAIRAGATLVYPLLNKVSPDSAVMRSRDGSFTTVPRGMIWRASKDGAHLQLGAVGSPNEASLRATLIGEGQQAATRKTMRLLGVWVAFGLVIPGLVLATVAWIVQGFARSSA